MACVRNFHVEKIVLKIKSGVAGEHQQSVDFEKWK